MFWVQNTICNMLSHAIEPWAHTVDADGFATLQTLGEKIISDLGVKWQCLLDHV